MGPGLRWAQQVAEARIARQLDQVDGLDTKAGLIFGYASAVLIGSLAIGTTGSLSFSFFLCSLVLAGVAVFISIIVLYPRDFNDPPNAEAFARDVADELVKLDWAMQELLRNQINATKNNERVIRRKFAGMKAGIAFIVAATLALFLQVLTRDVGTSG